MRYCHPHNLSLQIAAPLVQWWILEPFCLTSDYIKASRWKRWWRSSNCCHLLGRPDIAIATLKQWRGFHYLSLTKKKTLILLFSLPYRKEKIIVVVLILLLTGNICFRSAPLSKSDEVMFSVWSDQQTCIKSEFNIRIDKTRWSFSHF